MKILVIDNYDSFTYNLVHILRELTEEPVDVRRNDEIGLKDVADYDKIVISPGPGVPADAGITLKVIEQFGPVKSILGVCLGCQAIAEVYGGSLINLENVFHGVKTGISVTDCNDRLFRGIPPHFEAGRYHSWVVNEDGLPSVLKITARDDDGMIMALSHVRYDVKGVQFHPESVMTRHGRKILINWLDY